MKIKIKSGSCGIIYGMLVFVLFERFLESFGLPHSVIFLLDAFNAILLINLLKGKKLSHWFRDPILRWQAVVFAIGIIVAVVNFVKLPLILWALRNLIRFNIFYLACTEYLQLKDVKTLFNILKCLFFVNFVLIVFEYVVLGLSGDYLGGIFGVTLGANAYMNILLILVFSYEMVMWIAKKEKIYAVALVWAIAIIESLLCEIKIFFVEMLLIIFITFLINIIIQKKVKLFIQVIGIGCVAVLGLLAAINILGRMYPNFANFFTFEGFLYATTRESGYSGAGDLNRLTAIMTINKKFFADTMTRVFGMGLGSAEYSTSLALLTSQFYQQNNYLHYFWFSHAWMYLECGYIGLIGYIFSFLSQGFCGMKLAKKLKKDPERYPYLVVAIVVCFLTAVLYLYNQSLRLEIAYLLYFCFSIISIVRKEKLHAKR